MDDDTPLYCGECGRELSVRITKSHSDPNKEFVYLVCPLNIGFLRRAWNFWFDSDHADVFLTMRPRKTKYDTHTGNRL